MKNLKIFKGVLILLFVLTCTTTFSQTKGLIYKPATNTTIKAVLDPNGDGYTSTSSSGFTGTNDYGSSSELQMISLPVLFSETSGDIVTGSAGGHTDLVSNTATNTHSVDVLLKTVSGTQYLIVRFRIGKASTASKGYSLLIDSDSQFGTYLTSNNPGYDREVILETGNPGNVKVYQHTASGATTLVTYNADQYSQRSIAATTNDGDADYFYDFCVPLSDISASSFVRLTAATITSAQSGIGGTVSDFNGLPVYSNQFQAMNDIINSFPSTVKFTDMVEGFSFPGCTTIPPIITSTVSSASTSISGTSTEANTTVIKVYRKRSGTTTQLATGSTFTVTSNAWNANASISGNLAVGDSVWTTATASGRAESSASNKLEVTAGRTCPYIPPPVITARAGSQTLTGTWAYADGSKPATYSSVQLILSQQTADNTFSTTLAATPATQYVNIDGTFASLGTTAGASFATGQTNPNFNGYSLVLQAQYVVNGNTCTSGYSNVSIKTNGNVTQNGTATTAPTINTTSILASSTVSRAVQVTNNDVNAANIILYVNGVEVASTGTTAGTAIASGSSTTFNYTGFIDADVVVARAQAVTVSSPFWISPASNSITVTTTAVQTNTPVISGSYVAGSGLTVSGSCNEAAGTTIKLYKAGTTLLGTTTVNAYGGWSVTSLTLVAADVLTATGTASGRSLSATSSSVTVAASAPTAPTITTTSIYAAITTSISGTGGSGTVIIYEDGEQIGTATPSAGAWTATVTASSLYKGGVITSKNSVSGVTSTASGTVTVTGVNDFIVKNTSDANIATQTAGVAFNIKLTARDNTTATFTGYTGTNTVFGTYTVVSGGTTAAFTAGVLSSHSVTLNKAGTWTLTTLSSTDPTTLGTSNSFTVNHSTATKLLVNTQVSTNNSVNTAFGTQPVIYITDAYDNVITEDNSTQVTVSIISGTNGTLSGTTTVTAINGVVTFSGLKISGAGRYTLRFTPNSALSTADSDPFNVGSVWQGTSSTSFNTASNWANNSVPTGGEDIGFDVSPTNHLVLTGDVTIGSFYNYSSKQLQLNGNKLTVTGSFNQSSATIEASTSTVEMAGSSAQTIPANTFINNKVCNLRINNNSGVTLGGTLDITCKLSPLAGAFNTNDLLVIGSDATTDGVVDVVGATASITGKVTVERYIPAKRAWRMLTAPVSNTGSVWSTWQNSGVYTAGTGILISGPTAGQSNNGLDVTSQNNSSLFQYNSTTNVWDTVKNTKTLDLSGTSGSAANKAYLVFIRGDRDPANAYVGAYNQTTLRAAGNLQTGNQVFNLSNTSGKLTMLGNPYACPIDFDLVYSDAANSSSNINRKFWFYDPKLNSLGGYITVAWNGSSYTITPSDGTTPWRTRYIQSGQAYFVETNATGGSPTLTIKESHKSTSNIYGVYRPGTQTEELRVNLNVVNNDGSKMMADGIVAIFNNQYSTSVDGNDATKITNFEENLAFKNQNASLSIEARPLADAGDTLFLNFTKTKLRNYEFSIDASNFNAPGLNAYLEDSYLNTSTLLNLAGNTQYQFTVTSATGAWAANRFRIVFKSSTALPVSFTTIKAYEQGTNQVKVEWKLANEAGVSKYQVERSADGRSFTKAGTVNSTNSGSYNWIDVAPFAGNNYYRIKSLNANGEGVYTSIVKVNLGKQNGGISVYPNPVVGTKFNLELSNIPAGDYTINLYNHLGQKVFEQSIYHNGGSASFSVSPSTQLSGGIYKVSVEGAEMKQNLNIIIK